MPQRRDSGFLYVLILAFIALLVAVIGHREGAPGPSDAKMKANSLANLVRIAEKLGLTFTTMEDSAGSLPYSPHRVSNCDSKPMVIGLSSAKGLPSQ